MAPFLVRILQLFRNNKNMLRLNSSVLREAYSLPTQQTERKKVRKHNTLKPQISEINNDNSFYFKSILFQ